MDPVSHCLLGRAVACLDRRQWLGRGATAAAVLGAIAPDVDILWAAQGWDVYLVHHEAGTHALIWSPVLALAAAVLVWAVVGRERFARLAVAAWLGVAVGHLLLDLISGSDMRLFAPIWRTRLGPHWFAMADLLLITAILAGGLVTLRQRAAGAVLTFALIGGLVAVKAASRSRAAEVLAAGLAAEGGSGWIVDPLYAVNGSVSSWRTFGESGHTRRAWLINAWTAETRTLFTRESIAPEQIPVAAWRTPILERFLTLPGVFIVTREANTLFWSHLRDCSETTCNLSFGLEIDERGRPVRELVRLGPWIRSRPMPADHPTDGGADGRRP